MPEISGRISPFCLGEGLTEVDSTSRGSKFAGQYRGRAIEVECHRSSRTQNPGTIQTRVYDGHRLNITLSTPVMTRLVVSSAAHIDSPVTGMVAGAVAKPVAVGINQNLGGAEVAGLRPDYANLGATASELAWATPTLNNGEVASLVGYLLADASGSKRSKLTMGPGPGGTGTLWLQIVTTGFDPAQVGHWVESIERLLVAIEAMPRPTVTEELTKVEAAVAEDPKRAVLLLIGGIVLVSFVIAGLLVGLAVLLGSGNG